MTATVRQQIRDRIILELNTDRPGPVPEATKRRFIPGQRLVDPRLAVFFGPTEDVGELGRGFPVDDRALIISIQAAVAVEDPGEADDAAEVILAWVVGVLGNTDLNKMATKIVEIGTEWASAQADLFYHSAVMRYSIRYQTRRGDLTLKQ